MIAIINRRANRPKTAGSTGKPPKPPRKKTAGAAPSADDPYDAVTRVDLPHITLADRKILKPYERRY